MNKVHKKAKTSNQSVLQIMQKLLSQVLAPYEKEAKERQQEAERRARVEADMRKPIDNQDK